MPFIEVRVFCFHHQQDQRTLNCCTYHDFAEGEKSPVERCCIFVNAPRQDWGPTTSVHSNVPIMRDSDPAIFETSSARCFHRQKPQDRLSCNTDHRYHFPLTFSAAQGYAPRLLRQNRLPSLAPASLSFPPQSPSPCELPCAGDYVVAQDCVAALRSPHCEIDSIRVAVASETCVARSLLRTRQMRDRRG